MDLIAFNGIKCICQNSENWYNPGRCVAYWLHSLYTPIAYLKVIAIPARQAILKVQSNLGKHVYVW